MRVDRALLDGAAGRGPDRPLLRLYRWSPPALSLGRHQTVPAGVTERAAARGVEVVRRPTGGSAVLHGGDLTYALVAPVAGRSVLEAYAWVAEGLIRGLARLGLEARIARHPGRSVRGAGPACFASSQGADLEVGGAKLCGSAQVRARDWFLQHGSIPLIDQRALLRTLLRHAGVDSSTCLEALRPGASWDLLAECLIGGFEDVWGPARRIDGTPADFRVPARSMVRS